MAQFFPTTIERSPSALVKEARAAYDAELFVACLTLLVTIPDVCSHLIDEGVDAKTGGLGYRAWCEGYLDDVKKGFPLEDINRSPEQTREEIDRTFERLTRHSAFTSSDLLQLRNAVLHTGSSRVEGKGAKHSQYHSIGVYVTDSDSSLLCSYGMTSNPTTRGTEDNCRFEVVISLSGLLARMEKGVGRFLQEHPRCDVEYGKRSSLHWGIVDMRQKS